ncbi:hypothetical protein BCON_0075g00100 [Botryotinia convoluta]|uniref:Uncharacterized protein n=1 Tax=Botryotinia convoluta TaxID=54673 RepID=A0A4Z1ICD9_9HELO|nr:hypothetical protein BCON_0075g00100 [Botryotinia convoluta]
MKGRRRLVLIQNLAAQDFLLHPNILTGAKLCRIEASIDWYFGPLVDDRKGYWALPAYESSFRRPNRVIGAVIDCTAFAIDMK